MNRMQGQKGRKGRQSRGLDAWCGPREPSPHPDPLPSHPMGAERGQLSGDEGRPASCRQPPISPVPRFKARNSFGLEWVGRERLVLTYRKLLWGQAVPAPGK